MDRTSWMVLAALLVPVALALGATGARAQDHPDHATTSSGAEAEGTAAPDASAVPDDSEDREARDIFEAGMTAFEAARYQDAIDDFERAYHLSRKPLLLYNVAVTADRLRLDQKALDAFTQFLGQVPDSPRRAEVTVRIAAIRRSMASHAEPPDHGATTHATTDASSTSTTSSASHPASGSSGASHGATAQSPTVLQPPRREGPSPLSIAAPAALGAVGLAGTIAALVGMVGGGCLEHDTGGTCLQQRDTHWLAVGLYGGVGLAALTGAVVWLVAVLSDHGEPAPAAAGGPSLRWSF